MKKSELKPAKKKIKDDIKSGLIKELTIITGRFGKSSEKLEKVIAKGSKKLAKKIAKRIKIAETITTDVLPAIIAPAEKQAKAVKSNVKPGDRITKAAKPAVKKSNV